MMRLSQSPMPAQAGHRKTRYCLLLAALPALLLSVGCQTRSEVRPFSSEVPLPPQFVNVVERCNGADAAFAMGQPMTPALLEEARNRAGARSAVTAQPGNAPTPPDPLRLIVEVDSAGRMMGARCG